MAQDFSNYINTYKGSSVLQQQFPNMNDYLALFGYNQGTTPTLPVMPTNPNDPVKPEEGITNIIGQDLRSGAGSAGIPSVGSPETISAFNQAIDTRQNRLNNPGKIAQFAYDIGVPKQASYNEMLSRGMLGAKDMRATSGIPLGIGSMLARAMPDNYYDKMTLGDQILTQSYMGYTDPNTNMANKDKTVNKLNEALVASAKKKGLTFDPVTGKVTGNQSIIDAWNDLTKNMQTRRNYYTNVTNKKKDIAADLALIQKAKEEKAKQDAAKAAAQLAGVSELTGNVNTGGGKGIASSGVASGNVDPSGMGGGSRQAKSSGSQNTGRTDGGWGWKTGGLVTMFKLKG